MQRVASPVEGFNVEKQIGNATKLAKNPAPSDETQAMI
jgi:hypothetical protein